MGKRERTSVCHDGRRERMAGKVISRCCYKSRLFFLRFGRWFTTLSTCELHPRESGDLLSGAKNPSTREKISLSHNGKMQQRNQTL